MRTQTGGPSHTYIGIGIFAEILETFQDVLDRQIFEDNLLLIGRQKNKPC